MTDPPLLPPLPSAKIRKVTRKPHDGVVATPACYLRYPDSHRSSFLRACALALTRMFTTLSENEGNKGNNTPPSPFCPAIFLLPSKKQPTVTEVTREGTA